MTFNLKLPLSSLSRLVTSMSVRMRIIVIALVPVLGFLANGFTFTGGEAEVDHAFESVR